jgi:SSS family transporter
MYELTVYDYLVLSFVLLVSISIGLYHAIKSKWAKYFKSCCNQVHQSDEYELEHHKTNNGEQIREYLIASGSMSALPIAFSLLASFFSATALLGFPAEVYQYGIQYWISIFGMMMTPIIGALATGPLFARLKVISVFEYLKLRYDSTAVRLLSVTCYFVRNMISIAIFLYGPATTVTALTKISTPVAVLIIGAISTFYTTIGGIKAVIWTDVFQMIMMFTGLITVISKGVYDIGGFSELWKINSEGGRLNFFDFDPNPFIRQSFWPLFFGMIVHFSMSYCLDQQMVQRFSAAKNVRSAQLALLLNVPGIMFLVSLCCFTGLILYATYATCDPMSAPELTGVKNPNQLLTYFVTDKLKILNGMAGLFLATILSGSLSSISSCLNSLAAIVLEDFLKRFRYFRELNDNKITWTAKLLVIVAGCLCTGLALVVSNLGGNLVQISSTLNGAFNAPVIGVFVLACVFPFTNSIGAIFGLVSGFSMALWLSFGAYLKQPLYPKLNVSSECYDTNLTTLYNTSILIQNATSIFLRKSDKEAMNLFGFDRFYSISYMWFSAIGALTTLLVGIFFSLITGCNKKRVSKELILFKCLEKFQKFSNKDELKGEIFLQKSF